MSLGYTITPPHQPTDLGAEADADLMDGGVDDADMDAMVDGDRQLTTDSDAIDGGLNDSDLGSSYDGVPDADESGLDADNGTGLTETR